MRKKAVSPAHRRTLAQQVVKDGLCSQRAACRFLRLARSTFSYQEPKASVWGTLTLALRNAVKPSRVLRLTYSLPSIIEPGRTLELVVEANVTERKPHRAVVEIPFSFPFRDKSVETRIKGYDIH